MRKYLTFALCAICIVMGINLIKPAVSQPSEVRHQSQQMSALHQHDTPIPSPQVLAMGHLEEEVNAEEVTYGTIGETPLTGYMALPANADPDTPLPGIIVIQEWWGLNENIEAMTRHLAAEGYSALAVDLYDDQIADTPDDARALVQAALADPDRLTQNVVAAYHYLADTMAAPKVASLGWCFGGTWSLNTALALPDQLDAAVIYYGGGITTDEDSLATLEMPIQGHFGLLDSNPSPETVQKFEQVLDSLGKDAEVYQYANAGHAFANPSGTKYNEAAAELAWDRTVRFLNETL